MRDRHAKGSLYFSMENKFQKAVCSKCNNAFSSVYDYCEHLNNRRKTKDSTRVFQGSNFVGAGVVVQPADKLAGTLALAEDSEFYWISEIANAKSFQQLDIKTDVIPYLLWREGIEMRKFDLPTTILDEYSALDGIACADDVNRVFPIDSEANIKNSAQFLLNNSLNFYTNEEKLYVTEKLAKAAKNISLDITELIDNPNGGIDNMIDKNSPEFKEAVAAEVAAEMKKLESSTELKQVQEAKADAEKLIAELKDQISKIELGKKEAETALATYKGEIEKEKVASARFAKLTEAGFAFAKNADKVKAQIGNMSDEEFASYVEMLEEASAAKNPMTEEMKKMMEEKKAAEDKKKKEAKAEEDIVTASNKTAIANKIEDSNASTSALDEVLALCK